MEIPFRDSADHTLGVEWEMALVDREDRDLRNAADEVRAAFGAAHPEDVERLHGELLRNTVEIVTGIHPDVAGVAADLSSMLERLRVIASGLGLDLLAAGTHPFATFSPDALTPSPRYQELLARTQWWGRQMLIWGVHVHVGLRREHVMPVVSSLVTWFPHLQALSASSPVWAGTDTGYASNRAMMFQQLPTAGLPFQFARWEEFEAFVSDQMKTGVIDQVDEIRWDIRPAPHLGTVEVRISDCVPTMTEMRALVALTHCLVVDLCARLDAGETLDVLPPWHAQENKWRAARYGLDAWVIVDSASRERLMREDLAELLERLAPVAARLGCSADLALVDRILAGGASYERQRRVAARTGGNLMAVVDSVVAELGTDLR